MDRAYGALISIVAFNTEWLTIHGDLLDGEYQCEPGDCSFPSQALLPWHYISPHERHLLRCWTLIRALWSRRMVTLQYTSLGGATCTPLEPVAWRLLISLPSTRSGLLPIANVSVNQVVVCFPGKLDFFDFFECYLGTTIPARATSTSLLDADQGLMVPARGYSAVHIPWRGNMYADGSCVRGVY